MRVDNFSALSSISAFLTYLKRIQTPHRVYFGTLEQIKLRAAEFEFESKFEPLPVIRTVILKSILKSIQEDNRMFRGQNQ